MVMWTESEDSAVRAYYADHGPRWDGWAEVLPGRSARAISARAQRLGVAEVRTRVTDESTGRKESPDPLGRHHYANFSAPLTPDPEERFVMGRMGSGATPSEIDRERKWRPGTAKSVLTHRWARLKERKPRDRAKAAGEATA